VQLLPQSLSLPLFLVYVDDGIIAGPDAQAIEQIIIDLKTKFKVSDEGDLTDYLGVNIKKQEDGTIKLSQPHLIDQIIEDANFQTDTKFKSIPAASTKILNKDKGGGRALFHYRDKRPFATAVLSSLSQKREPLEQTTRCNPHLAIPRLKREKRLPFPRVICESAIGTRRPNAF
jgi:hypothetical protein